MFIFFTLKMPDLTMSPSKVLIPEQEAGRMESEEDKDVGLPPELERIIAQEDREMRLHQEETELVDLGTGSG